MVIKLPENVKLILDLLDRSGYEAYIVGGCVRDSLMNNEPHDWDICTSAMPEQVEQVFKDFKIIPTGLKHGTMSVVINNSIYEVTTFRIDGEYEDNRHPKNVEFTNNINLDLSRRDFTINAIAYSDKTGLIDPFNGQRDIRKKVIRCVGDPNKRFNEDALRLMRALRFAERYNFTISNKTYRSILKNKYLLTNISIERFNDELTKILSVSSFRNRKIAYCLFDCLGIVTKFKSYDYSTLYHKLTNSDKDLSVRLAIIFGSLDYIDLLKLLRFSNNTIKAVSEIIDISKQLRLYIDTYVDPSLCKNVSNEVLPYIARKTLSEIEHASISQILQYTLSLLDTPAQVQFLSKITDECFTCIQNGCIYNLSNLAVDGNDIKDLGFNGKEIGNVLNNLLEAVIRGDIKNEKTELLNAAIKAE